MVLCYLTNPAQGTDDCVLASTLLKKPVPCFLDKKGAEDAIFCLTKYSALLSNKPGTGYRRLRTLQYTVEKKPVPGLLDKKRRRSSIFLFVPFCTVFSCTLLKKSAPGLSDKKGEDAIFS
jgi:hypothetical protein